VRWISDARFNNHINMTYSNVNVKCYSPFTPPAVCAVFGRIMCHDKNIAITLLFKRYKRKPQSFKWKKKVASQLEQLSNIKYVIQKMAYFILRVCLPCVARLHFDYLFLLFAVNWKRTEHRLISQGAICSSALFIPV
jgi:hypothetical protein